MAPQNLTLLILDLKIPHHWEVQITKQFPDDVFVIQRSQPSGENSCAGVLSINPDHAKLIAKFLKNHPYNMEFEPFDSKKGLYYFKVNNCALAKIINCGKCFEEHPTQLQKDIKRLKISIREDNIPALLNSFAQEKIMIKNMIKINYELPVNGALTATQQKILDKAIAMGYYLFPRTTTLKSLAKELKISPSTLCVHLQSIENKILEGYSQKLK